MSKMKYKKKQRRLHTSRKLPKNTNTNQFQGGGGGRWGSQSRGQAEELKQTVNH